MAAGAETFARYPFLSGATAWLAENAPTLDELVDGRAYRGARRKGLERALGAIHDATRPARAPLPPSAAPHEAAEDLFSYAFARILVSALNEDYVVRRHALAEALRVRDHLAREPDLQIVGEAARAFGIHLQEAPGGGWKAPFPQFLVYAVHMKDLTWKLVNQPLSGGLTALTQERVARLVQEALRRQIETELPKPVPEDVVEALATPLGELRVAAQERMSSMQADQFGETDLDCMPPCMKHILAMLQRGENAPHSARFAITSFLHTIGMDTEEIMKLFSQAPDFREDLTRYQVEHITGASSSTNYTPPGCQAMKTYGICYNADSRCQAKNKQGELYVTHPLSYYRWALKDRNRCKAGGKDDATQVRS